jgi:hypothetical protein
VVAAAAVALLGQDSNFQRTVAQVQFFMMY